MYRRNQVFGLQNVQNPVRHLDDVAIDKVLEHQVCLIFAKAAYLELHRREKLAALDNRFTVNVL